MEPSAPNLDDNQQARQVLTSEIGEGAEQFTVSRARRKLVGNTQYDDARMRAGQEAEDVRETGVRSDEDPIVRPRVVEDLLVRLPAEANVAHVLSSEAGMA